MNKDFMQYVYVRCDKALMESEEYVELQNKCLEAVKDNNDKLANDISDHMEAKAEELCYLQGFNDAMQLMLGLK